MLDFHHPGSDYPLQLCLELSLSSLFSTSLRFFLRIKIQEFQASGSTHSTINHTTQCNFQTINTKKVKRKIKENKRKKMLELRLNYLVAILAMFLKLFNPRQRHQKLVACNPLTSRRVARVIIVNFSDKS